MLKRGLMKLRKFFLLIVGIICITLFLNFTLKNTFANITLEDLFMRDSEYNVFKKFELSDNIFFIHSDNEVVFLEKKKTSIIYSFDNEELIIIYVFHLDSLNENEMLTFYTSMENKINKIIGVPSKIDIDEDNFYRKTVYWDNCGNDNSVEILLDLNVDSYSGEYIVQIICLKNNNKEVFA